MARARASDRELLAAGLDPAVDGESEWVTAPGCPVCRETGHLGRTAVIERIDVTPQIAELMIRRAPSAEIIAAAEADGMVSLRTQATELARQGITSLAEIARVIQVG